MTERVRKFVESYVATGNATQAAKDAGFSFKTAYSQGNRLLKNVEVQAALKEINEQISNQQICSAEEVQQLLSKIARGEHEEEILFNVKGTIHRARKKVSATVQVKALESLCKILGLYQNDSSVTVSQQPPIILVDDVRE